MHLKRVEIFGFKSFADKTEIKFEKGITCIVGPNGCGKSNISDAIRWVLGERSAKMLRGSRMEDVIFSGTEFRKPVSMAEVSLTIDNADKILPIAYDEVVITRRLYRSGESEYLINKTPCRYKDIQDLILDTGIGSSSYSMIEQGKIDYILNAHEDERRFLIEEAAGISKYKVKKEEALRKLERTEANLLRLNDIVSEVDKNIRYAERQAKRAEKYKLKLEDLKKLELQKALYETELLQNEKTSLQEELALLGLKLQQSQSELDQEEVRFKELDGRFAEVEGKTSSVEQKKYDIKLSLSQTREKVRQNVERHEQLDQQNRELEKESAVSNLHIEAFQNEFTTKEADIASARSETERLRERVGMISAELSQAQEAVASKDSIVKEYQAQLFNIARQSSDFKNRLHQIEVERQNCQSQRGRAQQAIERLLTEKEDCLRRIEALGEDPELLSNYTAKNTELQQRVLELQAVDEELQRLDSWLREKQTELTESDSQINLLESLEREGVFSDAVTHNILEESRREGSLLNGIVQSLWEVVEVREGYEGAIRAALADWAHALVVENPEQAMKVIHHARENQAREFYIMINAPASSEETNESSLPELPGVRGKAADFITLDPRYAGLLQQPLRNVVIVDSLTTDRLVEWAGLTGNYKIVSLDGFVLGPGQRIQFLGNLASVSYVSRKRDIQALRDKILVLRADVTKREAEKEAVHQRRNAIAGNMEEIEDGLMQVKVSMESSGRLKESLAAQLARLEEEIEIHGNDIRHSEIESARLESEKKELDTLSVALKQKESQDQIILQQELEKLNTLLQRKDDLLRTVTEEEQKFERCRDRERYALESLELLKRNQESEKALQHKRIAQMQDNVRIMAELRAENTEKEAELVVLERNYGILETESQAVAAERMNIAQLRTSIFSALQEKKAHLDKSRERERDIQLKEMELSYKQNAIEERMRQSYHVDIKELDKTLYDLQNVNVEERDAEIQSLQRALESIGTVNLLAIEEYESLKERYGFLSTQKQDLEKGREDLLEAIRKINRTTKKLFEDTFAQVQSNFREYFKILFGGGQAELILVDESNPLESGIDIMVRPPGKKNQNISLLSGGEKALTATALLFALFKIKPSPFCVLDEIDAPLDESNVHRFLEVVRSFLVATQFIVVTHNRKTIASGDSLYGVTMEEAGVSKLVSVKLTDNTPYSIPDKVEAASQEMNELVN